MWAICKKDLASLFHSFIGWLFAAILWALMSLYIGMYCFIGLDPDIADVLAISGTLLMVLLPILCMRSFAEERRSGTDQLILTAPIPVGEVVLGKFLALGTVYTIVVLGLCCYPLILSAYGSVPYAESYTGLFGMWLFGLAEIAICIFVSSLTESVIIAAVVSAAVLFASLIIPNLQSMISSDGNFVTVFLGALDIPSRFDTFLNGTLDLASICYLVSVAALFLFLTTQVIQKRRYQVSRRTLRFGAYSTGMIAVVLAIVVVANLAVNQLPSSFTRLDITQGGLYSLTEETKEYLAELDDDVVIYVMSGESDADATLDATLRNMAEQTSRLTVTYVDPASNPSFLQEYEEVMDAYWNSLIVESGERYTVVDYYDIYEYSIDYTTYSTTITGYDAEGQIDSAIAYVTSSVLPKVYILTGHGEYELGSNFTDVLQRLNCETADLDLMVTEEIPGDCEVLIINAPTSDLSEDDAEKILSYLASGGDLIAATSFEISPEEMPNYSAVLAFYGVSWSEGVVLESDQGYYYRYESYLLPDIASETETQDITNGYVFVAYSQALYEDADSAAGDASYTELLTTSENAYLHEGVDAGTTDFSRTSGDASEKYVLGLKAEVRVQTASEEEDDPEEEEAGSEEEAEDAGESDAEENEEEEDSPDSSEGDVTSIGYFFGSSMIFSDTADAMVSGSNASLFSGLLGERVDGEGVADQILVAAKTVSSSYLTIPTLTSILLCLFCIVVIPAALLITGFVMWLLRRRR